MDTKLNSSLVYYISVVVILLMAIGTVFVFSAGASISNDMELHRFYDVPSLRQIIFFPLAILIMFAVSKIDYHNLSLNKGLQKSPVFWLLILSVILVMLVLVPRFGAQINQARRWFRIPLGFMTISFQPSELAKWATVFFMVGFCCKYRDSLQDFWKKFAPAVAIMAVPVGLIIIEDFGTAALITLLTFMILLIGGAKYKHVLAPLPLGAVAFTAAIIHSPHRVMRIAAFLNPEKWADTVAYQANQSLIALGSGGMLGKGIGCGICKYGHLPEDTTDFIFAIVGEEMGFIGTAAVIALFIAFIWLGAKVVKNCKDEYGKFLAAAIILGIGTQAALNIGVVTVVLPTKGLPLPFVSAGGTSMLLTAAAVGVLLNIARQAAVNSTALSIGELQSISAGSAVYVAEAIEHEVVEEPAVEENAEAATAGEQRQTEVLEHERTLAALEAQATELVVVNRQPLREICEYPQTTEQPAQDSFYIEQQVNKRVWELRSAKKMPKRDAGEPLDTKELEELAAMTKRLAQK